MFVTFTGASQGDSLRDVSSKTLIDASNSGLTRED